MRASPMPCHTKAKQRGAALMVMIVIMVVGIASILVSALSSSALQSARQEKTAAALAQAKDALIGRAVVDANRPGSLPCPDLITNTTTPILNVPNDGVADSLSGNNCPSYIGRLPWKTLGLPDLRDGFGERLWYALSPNFRDDNSNPINSNNKGTLLVYSADGATPQTAAGYDAVAIIFSPGSAIGSQTRSTAAEQNSAANYLDIANSRNNASANGPFIAGAKSETFNDQLIFITTINLVPLLEQRVAGEVKQALTNYYTVNGYYPWADAIGPSSNYDSDEGLSRGWLPNSAAIGGGNPTPNWAVGSPPQWFFDNKWYTLIYYSLARNRKPPSNCSSCIDNTLSVNGVSGVNGLFFMPGTPIGALTRAIDSLPDYLEDPQNKDNANDLYVTPASQAQDRDRLYLLQ